MVMKQLILLLFAAASLLAADVTGTWEGTLKAADHDGQAYLVLVQHGDQVTGSAGPGSGEQHPISNGKVKSDGAITFEVNDGSAPMTFSLRQTDDEIRGLVTRDHDGEKQTAELVVRRNRLTFDGGGVYFRAPATSVTALQTNSTNG